ncbi:hypothetical protein CPU03_17290 (plasmid) [Edwardsiella tarda]|nr:hypothetical protein CPU03_17290 [Edwardsiella tarda]
MKSTAAAGKPVIISTQFPRIKRDIRTPLRYREHPGGRHHGARSLLPVACTPRPATGQADRGISQPSVF